jgi:hypothetical protein
MNPTLKKWLIGALAGGAGGAGLSGLLAHSKKVKGESQKQRRKRIMRQALLGGGLGAGVGSLPAGIEALTSSANNPSLSFKPKAPGNTGSWIGNNIPGMGGQTLNFLKNLHKPFDGKLDKGFDWASGIAGTAGVVIPGKLKRSLLSLSSKEIGDTTRRQLNSLSGKLGLGTSTGNAMDGSRINDIKSGTGTSRLRKALLSKKVTGGATNFSRQQKAYNLLRNSGLEHSGAGAILGSKGNPKINRLLRSLGMNTSGSGANKVPLKLQARGLIGQATRGLAGFLAPQLIGQGLEVGQGMTDSSLSTRQGQSYALGVIRNIEDKLRLGKTDYKPGFEDVSNEMSNQISSGQLDSGMGLTNEAVKAFFDPARRDSYGAGGTEESIGQLADEMRKGFSNYGTK